MADALITRFEVTPCSNRTWDSCIFSTFQDAASDAELTLDDADGPKQVTIAVVQRTQAELDDLERA